MKSSEIAVGNGFSRLRCPFYTIEAALCYNRTIDALNVLNIISCLSVPLVSDANESSICLSGLVFSTVLGVLAVLVLMSSVTTSLLCLRMKTMKKTENDSYDMQADVTAQHANTMARRSASTTLARKSEYVHSAQQRIP